MDLDAILRTAGTLAREVLAPRAEDVDRTGAWPEEGLRSILDAGFGGLVLPRRYGGLGQGLLGLTRVCEVLATGCASTSMCFGMHAVGSAVIAARPGADQEERFLRPIAAGRHLTTLALSETGTGAHFYFPETRASRIDGGFRIDGQKSFVTNGGHADSYVLSVVSGEADAEPGEFSCIVVPAERPGLRWSDEWQGLGMRGNASRTLELEGVEVPAGNLLGRPGDQVWYVFEIIAPYFLMAMTGTYLGIARLALDLAVEHLKSREHAHTGQPLSAHPVIQHRLGTLWALVERTRRLAFHAAGEVDRGEPEALPALLSAKAEVAEAAVQAVNEALTLTGGRGYAQHGVMGRLLRDARAAHVMAPTTDVLRQWVGRSVLGEPLLGDPGWGE